MLFLDVGHLSMMISKIDFLVSFSLLKIKVNLSRNVVLSKREIANNLDDFFVLKDRSNSMQHAF